MPSWTNYRQLPWLVILVTTVCIVIIWQVANHMDRNARKELMNNARIAALSIDPHRLKHLSGKASDVELTDYQRIKEQLNTIRTGSKTCKFLYILAYNPQDNTVYFFVDSQKPDSSDYAPPGLIYEEVSDEFRTAVKVGDETFIGPVTDRWGTIMTSLIPLQAPDTGKVIAMLGMDVEANEWYTYITSRSIPYIVLTIVAGVLLIFTLFLKFRTRELHQDVSTDALTDVSSRKTILEMAQQEFKRSRRRSTDFAMLLIDMDDFKGINDQYGHQCGDAVLSETAKCIKAHLRKSDYVGRIGGEEFLVITPNTTSQDALNIAEKLRTMVAQLTFEAVCKPAPNGISISLGISHLVDGLENFNDMFHRADKALYASKKAGKNRVTLFDTTFSTNE